MRHRQELARAQQLLDQLTRQGLGAAVAEAFGDDYELRGWFSDRVDIQLTQPGPLQYVVFFGHVLDLTQPPGFTRSTTRRLIKSGRPRGEAIY